MRCRPTRPVDASSSVVGYRQRLPLRTAAVADAKSRAPSSGAKSVDGNDADGLRRHVARVHVLTARARFRDDLESAHCGGGGPHLSVDRANLGEGLAFCGTRAHRGAHHRHHGAGRNARNPRGRRRRGRQHPRDHRRERRHALKRTPGDVHARRAGPSNPTGHDASAGSRAGACAAARSSGLLGRDMCDWPTLATRTRAAPVTSKGTSVEALAASAGATRGCGGAHHAHVCRVAVLRADQRVVAAFANPLRKDIGEHQSYGDDREKSSGRHDTTVRPRRRRRRDLARRVSLRRASVAPVHHSPGALFVRRHREDPMIAPRSVDEQIRRAHALLAQTAACAPPRAKQRSRDESRSRSDANPPRTRIRTAAPRQQVRCPDPPHDATPSSRACRRVRAPTRYAPGRRDPPVRRRAQSPWGTCGARATRRALCAHRRERTAATRGCPEGRTPPTAATIPDCVDAATATRARPTALSNRNRMPSRSRRGSLGLIAATTRSATRRPHAPRPRLPPPGPHRRPPRCHAAVDARGRRRARPDLANPAR